MPVSLIQRWLRVTINDDIVRTTTDVSISASLNQLNRVCSITFAELPVDTPSDGDTVLIEMLDTGNGTRYDMFGGVIDGGPETESQPFNMTVRAVDQLADLRILHTGSDLNLTGMTVKEAKMAVFDYCDLDYDSDDLVEVDYTLGALEPVKWLNDGNTTGASIITEIDRVFGLTTQTIGNNRIISFRVDLLPDDDTGLYRTYSKGISVDFRAHRRTRGGRDDIQTTWTVDGVTHDFNDGSCSETPWAKAVQGTAKVGRSRRVPVATDQSDLIQDEALAEYVVRQHMRETSKVPDTGTAAVITSRNLHPGTKVAIIDPTYGITANPRYYCITQVEIDNLLTELTMIAGPAGNEGTVTTGVDDVCNDTHTDGDIPGSFDPPDLGFPPLDDGDFGEFPFPDEGTDEEPTPAPETDPFTDCTEVSDLGDVIESAWRESGTVFYSGGDGIHTDTISTTSIGVIIHNTTEGPTPKTTSNDVIYAQGETVCVSGYLSFPCDAGGVISSSLAIRLIPLDLGLDDASVTFYGDPGRDVGPFYGEGLYMRGVSAATEAEGAVFSPHHVPGVCSWIPFDGNNGGHEGAPLGYGVESPFSVCFDIASSPPRTYFSYDGGSGFSEPVTWRCIPFGPHPPPDGCDHTDGHKLEIFLSGSVVTTADADCPWVSIRDLSIGATTCVPNPDFVDPDRTGGRG